MKTLSGRLLDIATGAAGLPPQTRDAYRAKFAAMGYALPAVSENVVAVSESKVVSAFGTELRAAIEASIGRQLSCGDCLGYLRRLNQQETHDIAEIVQHLYAHFPWPAEWREKHNTPDARRQAILAIAYSMQDRHSHGQPSG